MPRTVGPFEVLDKLGAGGMGEVFKARDARLNRFVALKFLPELASADARERFQREAQAIAALNHPQICTLFEIGSDDGRPYLVLELLEGETLKARLRRGPLDPDLLLDWSVQITDALDAAHRVGILHRDLKPDNIWVSPGGHIKVLDFGLARLASQQSEMVTAAPTLLTSPGQTMGTIPYMSPEQARGETLDARSDLFSFGAVFYEMAAGRPAFPATNPADSIAAVIGAQPPKLAQIRPELTPGIGQIAERCLEKDPELRYQSASDLRSELKRLRRESGSTAAVAPAGRQWRWAPWALVAVLAVAAAGLAWRSFSPATPPASVAPKLHFRPLTYTGQVVDAVISPDGKFLAHIDDGPRGKSLHLLAIASGSDVEIAPPAVGCCQQPTFSPDESSVLFLQGRILESVPLLGGAIRTLATGVCSGAGFSPDGSRLAYIGITVAGNSQLLLVHPDGSQPRILAQTQPGTGYESSCWGGHDTAHAPAWSPDGRWIAVNRRPAGSFGHLEAINSADGHAVDIGPDLGYSADGSWLPDGRGLVFTAAVPAETPMQLWQTSFPDGRSLQLTDDLQDYSLASMATNGNLVLVHRAPQYSIWTQSRAGGDFQRLPGGGATQDGAAGLAWTPQDTLVSVRNLGGKSQIWTPAGPMALPVESISDVVVSPNGQILFTGGSPSTVWRVNADGSGLQRLVIPEGTTHAKAPHLVDGNTQVVYVKLGEGKQNLWTIPLTGGSPKLLWSGTVLTFASAMVSPDQRQIFTVSSPQGFANSNAPVVLNLTGSSVKVTPVPLDSRTMRPPYSWTPDGRAITYVFTQGNVANIWAFPLAGGKPYPITHFTDLQIAAYAYSRDGRLAISRGSPNQDAVLVEGFHAR